MLNALYYVGYGLLYLIAFWNIYILVMGVYRAHLSGKLMGVPKYLSLPTVIIGYVMDILSNMTIACVIFLDFPEELLVTDRLKRYKASLPETAWRRVIAEWICESLLDPFDPSGDHC